MEDVHTDTIPIHEVQYRPIYRNAGMATTIYNLARTPDLNLSDSWVSRGNDVCQSSYRGTENRNETEAG